MMSHSQRFLNAYVSIEKSLNEINSSRRYIPFSQLLVYTAKQNRLVSQHYDDLKEYNELRNAIVHERDDEMEIIAEPSMRTVLNIEHIAEVLQTGKYALNYASKPVITAQLHENILSVYHKMQSKHVTKIPVYENGTFQTLITMEQIAGWALENTFTNQSIQEVLRENTTRVYFTKESSSVSDVIKIFEKSIKKAEAAPIIIITKNGKDYEEPMGIIATYDLATILSAML